MYNKEDFEALRYPEYIWHFMHSDQPTSFLGFGDGYALSCHLACSLEDSPYCRLTCPPNYLDEELREFTNQLDCTPIINRWGGYEGLSSLYETFILKPLGHSFPTPWNEDCEKAIANMFAIKEALEISLDSLELRREELIKKTAWFTTFGLGQAAMALAILSPGYPPPQSGGLILASLLLYAIAFFSMNATFNR